MLWAIVSWHLEQRRKKVGVGGGLTFTADTGL